MLHQRCINDASTTHHRRINAPAPPAVPSLHSAQQSSALPSSLKCPATIWPGAGEWSTLNRTPTITICKGLPTTMPAGRGY